MSKSTRRVKFEFRQEDALTPEQLIARGFKPVQIGSQTWYVEEIPARRTAEQESPKRLLLPVLEQNSCELFPYCGQDL